MNRLSTLAAVVFTALIATMAESAWTSKSKVHETASPVVETPVQALPTMPVDATHAAMQDREGAEPADNSLI